MIVLDACVLIAHFESTDAHHDRATQLLAGVGDIELAASALTLAEVLVGFHRIGAAAQAQAAVARLGIRAVDLPGDAAPQLAALRASTGLKLPDCCVLQAAETHGALLATFDDRLAQVASARGVTVLN